MKLYPRKEQNLSPEIKAGFQNPYLFCNLALGTGVLHLAPDCTKCLNKK